MATVAGKSRARESARESTHSGRLLLRMPRAVHAQLAARADEAGLSLNQYIVETLSGALEGDRPASPAPEGHRAPRSIRVALVTNAIVVALAAGTCIAVLVLGLR